MQLSDFRSIVEMPVRWGDMDSLRHVNNVQFFRYLESGRVAYIEEVFSQPLESPQTAVLADMRCTFHQQLIYPATIQIGSRVARLGRSSCHMTGAIFKLGEAQPVATAQAVVVWFDFVAQRSTPIPDEVRDRVRAFEVIAPTEN